MFKAQLGHDLMRSNNANTKGKPNRGKQGEGGHAPSKKCACFLGNGSQGSTRGEEIYVEEHAPLDAREGFASPHAPALRPRAHGLYGTHDKSLESRWQQSDHHGDCW